MVVVNLYPFETASTREDATSETARAHIDIGGPCMLRAGAKNFLRVAAVCNPDRYGEILRELKKNRGALSFQTRYTLAREVFETTAAYDATIGCYLAETGFQNASAAYKVEQ
jgi:phosphoribosylaminoimidazolecarboxamide formyltransferase / IMP cyclohydrolase